MNNSTDASPIWEQTQTLDPLGTFWVAASEQGLLQVRLLDSATSKPTGKRSLGDNELTFETLLQLQQYLHGQRKAFTLPIDWSVFNPFTLQVLKSAFEIPFGELTTYGDLAKLVKAPRGARAVGGAMSRNPILIVIPCHRVINAQRKLTGYSAPGGLETKSWLLKLEGHSIDRQKLV